MMQDLLNAEAQEGIRRDNASIHGKHKANNEERREMSFARSTNERI